MLCNKSKQIISYFLLFVICLSFCGNVFAEEPPQIFDDTISESIVQINAKIVSEFNATVDMETGSCVNLEYDSQGRIIKLTAQTGNKQEVINYIYNDNGTYSQDYNVTTLEETGSVMTAYVESGIELMSSDGSYDDVITDSSVKKRIKEAQDVWNKVPSMRTLAHIEAEVARADYCVVYPKSEFAKRFLQNMVRQI